MISSYSLYNILPKVEIEYYISPSLLLYLNIYRADEGFCKKNLEIINLQHKSITNNFIDYFLIKKLICEKINFKNSKIHYKYNEMSKFNLC